MNMWVVGKIGSPRVHDTDKTRCGSHMYRVFGKLQDCFRHSMKKKRIQFFLVAVDQGIQFAWAGKYKVIIVNVQYIFILCVNPHFVSGK